MLVGEVVGEGTASLKIRHHPGPICSRCDGQGYRTYTTTTHDRIKFKTDINVHHIEKGPEHNKLHAYSWRVECNNCHRGLAQAIPMSEFWEIDLGIDYIY